MAKAFGNNTARLAIVGDNPMLLSGEDPTKVARASKANSIAYQPALEKSSISKPTGTSSPIRARHGRSRYFPTIPKMSRWRDWRTRFSASRVDQDATVATWEKHNAVLRERTNGQRPALPRAEIFGAGQGPTIGLAEATNGKAAHPPPRTASAATPTFRPRKSSPRRIAGASTGTSSTPSRCPIRAR